MLFRSATWFVADMFAGEKYSSAFLMYWNTAIHIGCFVINAITISKIKATIDSRRQLAKELSQARSELHQLRGWLGICAHCSSVRVRPPAARWSFVVRIRQCRSRRVRKAQARGISWFGRSDDRAALRPMHLNASSAWRRNDQPAF